VNEPLTSRQGGTVSTCLQEFIVVTLDHIWVHIARVATFLRGKMEDGIRMW